MPSPADHAAESRGYVGPVAHEITFDAQREPMFQDDQGNGWVPLMRYLELEDALRRIVHWPFDVGHTPERDLREIKEEAQRAIGSRSAAWSDPDDVQPNECHGCGHTAEVCECECPDIDAPDGVAASISDGLLDKLIHDAERADEGEAEGYLLPEPTYTEGVAAALRELKERRSNA